jgi:hypothetical protein
VWVGQDVVSEQGDFLLLSRIQLSLTGYKSLLVTHIVSIQVNMQTSSPNIHALRLVSTQMPSRVPFNGFLPSQEITRYDFSNGESSHQTNCTRPSLL